MDDLYGTYVRERSPAVQVEVCVAGVVPLAPVARRDRVTMGQRAYGLGGSDWVPGLLHAWYTSRLSGEWLALVELELRSPNGRAEVRLRTLVHRQHVRPVE